MDSAIYAAHMDSVLKLARRAEGVSRPQLIDDLNVTRVVASKLIEECRLVLDRTEGRTEYFKASDATPAAAPAVTAAPPKNAVKQAQAPAAVAVATPTSDSTGDDGDDGDDDDGVDGDDGDDLVDRLATIDAELIDTRRALFAAADKVGKALGEWAANQALVDSLQTRMTKLASKRMSLSS